MIRYERVYLPLGKVVADAPFYIQGDDLHTMVDTNNIIVCYPPLVSFLRHTSVHGL